MSLVISLVYSVLIFCYQFFEMLGALNIPKWFSRLCWNSNVHFGQPAPEPVLAIDEIYDTPPTEQDGSPPVDALPSAKQGSIGMDVMLDSTILLTKHKLTMSILGFFNLGLEFNPEVVCEFIAGLGSGRPFFSFFLHQSEFLGAQVLLSASSILGIKMGTLLYARVQERFLFYDNDHLTPAAVATLGLQTSTIVSACINLLPSEFADLVTVAMYLHDLHNLNVRLETVVINMVTDQERRDMVVKFMKWMVEYFVTPDVERENNPRNTKTNERCKWKHCEKFKTVSFEDIIECSAEATIASHLLRGAARSNSYVTLERLFQHYIRNSHPTLWKNLFKGSKTIAYFIKYVDVEDLNLAFSKFFDMNPGNYCFMHHLLKVRKMLTSPIVSAQDLIALTASSSSFDDNNADRFFDELRMKGVRLPADQGDLKMVYFLTASWMKISKEKVLFPLPPRNAQIITLLTVASWAKSLLKKNDKRMGKALIAQVGTGEGKSLIIAMMAIYFVKVLGKRVHILENNQGLLDKDVETMKPLFAKFGILTQQEGAEAEDKPTLTWTSTEMQNQHDSRREFCKGKVGVTYCLRRNLEQSFQESIMAEDYKPLTNTVLIVDEVDDLIVDEHPNQPYATKDIDQARFQRACTEAQIEIERAALAGEDFVISDFAHGDFAYETAAYAYQRSKSMVLNKDYAILQDGKYVILQDGKPIEVYDYALEYLKFIKHGMAPTFSSTYYVQSVPYLLSQYDCITGFSGSLGSTSERDFLAQQYKAWSFNTPSFLDTCTGDGKKPPKLMADPLYPGVPCVHVYDTEDQQVDKIVEMCLRLHTKVPVLVIAKSPEEAIAIEAKVKAALAERLIGLYPNSSSRNKYVQLFRQYKLNSITLDTENWEKIVSRATSKGPEEDRFCITITDPFGGRGHDFDVNNDEVNNGGGLAVIMTFIPASKRVWMQCLGRTSRKDNNGQYAVVLCADCSPVSSMKNSLVDYSLKDANATAIANLYKGSLIKELLTMQDDKQRKRLSSKEEEIVSGKRANRLCDLFYKAYGSMKEGKWPSCKEHVELRALLADTPYGTNALNSAYLSFQLEEHDAASADFAPPNMRNSAFWTAKDAADWIASNVVSPENAEPTDISNPLPPPPAQQWYDNPQRSDQEVIFSQEKGQSAAAKNNVSDQEEIFSQEKGPSAAAKNNVADARRVSKVVKDNDLTGLNYSDYFNYNEQQELPIDNTNEQPAPQMLPTAPLPRNVEFSADLDRLIILDENTSFLPPPPTDAPTRRPTAPRSENEHPCKPPVVALPIVFEVVPVLPPPPPGVPSHTVAANPTEGSASLLSTIVAASGTGSTESSGSVAMSLVGGIRFAIEVRELKELCVGDTNRLTNQMDAALKDRMYGIKSNDPLTVAVTDSAGNGVAGLAVSGAIIKARNEYTMIFRTNVTPEEYQYNMLLYGRKKVEVHCKGIQILSAQGVLIKPAPKLRPPALFAFYNAADNTRVPAGGTVLISSRDDPRFTLARPLFTAISIPYTGADISLPRNLPDCVITVAPDISGYNNEYSEKFILFGNETIPGEVKRIMLSKNNLVEGEWRVVLSWGKHPKDLDLYCITNFQPRKVYFGMKNEGGQHDPTMGSIELDIDVRQGFGPETITFTPNPAKKYRFIVHNYTGNAIKSLANSGGKIVVNKSRGPPVQFEVPTDIVLGDDGEIARFWHVFDLIEGVLLSVNKVTKVDLRGAEVRL